MQESYWEMESGFQFGKEQVGCPALITSFKLSVGVSHSSLSLSLFLFCIGIFCLFLLFYPFSDKV